MTQATLITDDGSDPTTGFDPGDVLRAVVAAQMVFTVGHYLTTGAFLTYFAYALRPSTMMVAVLAVTPELSETVAVWTRSVVLSLGSRKRTWLVFFVLARIAALGIPAMAIPALRPDDATAFWVLIAALAVSHACQSIAYTAYISWLSDLFPREHWGGAFALRRIANVAVMVLLPAGALLLRRDWGRWTDDDAVRTAYLAVFLGGNALLWLTILPLLRLPDVPMLRTAAAEPAPDDGTCRGLAVATAAAGGRVGPVAVGVSRPLAERRSFSTPFACCMCRWRDTWLSAG